MADPVPTNPKQVSHLIPVIAVILSMSALVGVFTYSQWPSKNEDNVTPVEVHKATNTTANTNVAVNTNATININSSAATSSDVTILSPNGGESFDINKPLTIRYSISQEFRKKISNKTLVELYLVRSDGIIAGNIGTITDYTKTSLVWNPQELIHNGGLDFTTNPTVPGKYTILIDVRNLTVRPPADADYPVDLFVDGYDQYNGQQVLIVRDGKTLDKYELLAQDASDSSFTFTSSTADWKTFSNDLIGLTFKYPPTLGAADIAFSNGNTGSRFTISFSAVKSGVLGKNVGMGGTAINYSYGIGGSYVLNSGYLREGTKYFLRNAAGNSSISIHPTRTITVDNHEILVVDQGSFPVEPPNTPSLYWEFSGGKRGAIMNLDGTKYPGLQFFAQTSEFLSAEEFETMLSTFTFTK